MTKHVLDWIKIHRKNYQLYHVIMLFSLSNMTCPSTVLHIKDFLVTYLILHSSQRMQRTLGPWQDRNPLNTWCRWLYNESAIWNKTIYKMQIRKMHCMDLTLLIFQDSWRLLLVKLQTLMILYITLMPWYYSYFYLKNMDALARK